MDKMRVLFLCTGNSARSQMAEAFLRHYASEKFEAYSAGLEPRPIRPEALAVMKELGIEMAGQHPKSLHDFMGKVHFSYLITMCQEAEDRCPTTFPGMGKREAWNIEDPATHDGSEDERMLQFRAARDAINSHMKEWLGTQGIIVE